jgi:type IV secretory pathway TraG/TraD family ATPase VirD4
MWDEAKADYVIDEIAEAMIPDSKSMESFWVIGARQLFAESFRYLQKNHLRSYDNLLEMTLKIDLRELQSRLDETIVGSLLDPKIDKTALSVRASLATHLRVLEHLDETDEGLSLLNFMKNNRNDWLFLSCQTDQRAFVKPIFSVWLSLIIKGMMARIENNGARTWIIIDELASLNRLPSLMTGLAEIRKYGGCFVLGFQDISQIEDIYGHLAAKTLSNLTGTKVLFRAVDTDMALRVSRYMGEQEKEVASESISFGAHQMRDGVNLSHQIQTKPVVSASQVMLLQNLEAYLRFPGSFPVAKITFSYLKCTIQNVVFMTKPIKEKLKVYVNKNRQNEDHEQQKDETNSDHSFDEHRIKYVTEDNNREKEGGISFDFVAP